MIRIVTIMIVEFKMPTFDGLVWLLMESGDWLGFRSLGYLLNIAHVDTLSRFVSLALMFLGWWLLCRSSIGLS